jgi:acyl dehydratase
MVDARRLVVSGVRTTDGLEAPRLEGAMSVSSRYIFSQSIGLRALGETAVRGALSRFGKPTPPTLPGRELSATVAPPSKALVDAYLRYLGSDPSSYGETLPPHLFPHWAFLLMSRTLAGIPYPILRVVNAGCKLEINRPLPRGEKLEIRARLESIDADDRKALMTQRIVTGTKSAPDALVAYLRTYVPLGGKKKSGAVEQPRATVPAEAQSLETWDLPVTAGLDYAKLAGDFNPIHWIAPYARAMGFKNPILHGFASISRSMETLNRKLFDGRTNTIQTIDVRFTRPLALPSTVSVFVKDQGLYVASSASQTPVLEGTFTTRA